MYKSNKTDSAREPNEAKVALGTAQFADARATAGAHAKLQQLMATSPQVARQLSTQSLIGNSPITQQKTVQRAQDDKLLQARSAAEPSAEIEQRPNNTGLPDQLKSGIESLSGMRIDHIKVHYNSDRPAQLNAHVYAQGNDIHVAPGQEQHLPHEAWHVVQQAQGRVKPTMQMKGDVPVNDDAGLEAEADVMGAKALGITAATNGELTTTNSPTHVIQAKILQSIDDNIVDAYVKARYQLGKNALAIQNFINGAVANNPAQTIDELLTWMHGQTDNDVEVQRVAKLKQDFSDFYFSIPSKTFDQTVTAWKLLDDKLEKMYLTLTKNKVQGTKAQYNVGTGLGARIDEANQGGWRVRGKHGGIGSLIPASDNHYVVGANSKEKDVGPERIYVKNITLTNGEPACFAWYSATHGDKKSKNPDFRLIIDNSRTLNGRRIVTPWDPLVPANSL